jgi:hypothetical protein
MNKFYLTSLLVFLVCMVNKVFLAKLPVTNFVTFCCSCARNVVKHLSHVKAAFLLKPQKYFLYTQTTFPCQKLG